jgi:plasmid stability protein
MSTNLSIKDVPDDIVERLRSRARRNHRSLQGELLAILEETVRERQPTLDEIHRWVQEVGLRTPSESTEIIRADRDAR